MRAPTRARSPFRYFGFMDIQITQREPGGVERHVDVAVPADAVREVEERTARRYTSQARLPGFRPGKAPPAMVRKRFADAIRQDVLQEVVQEAYKKVMEQEKLEPITQPHIHDLKFEPGEPLTFTLHMEVRPEVQLARVEGFRVHRPATEVTDEMVQEQLDSLRDQRATWAPTDDRPMSGDMVTVALATADEQGQIGEQKEYRLELGKDQAIPGIEDLIMEARAGETIERPVKWPEDFPDEAQRGQTKTVRVTLKEAKRKTSPDLDDAFAREVGDFESLDALREAVRKDLGAQAQREAETQLKTQLLDQIIEANPFDVPPSWVRQLVDGYANAYQIPDEDKERFAQEFRPLAERQVRRDLVVETIARDQNLRATEADVDDRVNAMATERGAEAGKLYAALQKAGRLQELEHQITEERVFAWLLERNSAE
ncbi:Trigger factor [Gemmatirosa kalamazoonensis]|uniref:Trigger factor n=2 Tax=Gemmatirosa kalamazoonensis TaxID=861299 RepID=W0RKU8_9BACT|nr:Trigger factor [Gemmatirosa kalamazoonensis]